MKDIRRLLYQLVLLLVVLFVLYLLVVFLPLAVPKHVPELENTPAFNAPQPDVRSAEIAATPQSFQYLLSFTDTGFAPVVLTVKKGETVRITNNSRTELDLTGDGPISAQKVALRNYVEITFDADGQFEYSDSASGKSGSIKVQ